MYPHPVRKQTLQEHNPPVQPPTTLHPMQIIFHPFLVFWEK